MNCLKNTNPKPAFSMGWKFNNVLFFASWFHQHLNVGRQSHMDSNNVLHVNLQNQSSIQTVFNISSLNYLFKGNLLGVEIQHLSVFCVLDSARPQHWQTISFGQYKCAACRLRKSLACKDIVQYAIIEIRTY